MSRMAEVLAAHQFVGGHGGPECSCTCEEMFYDWRRADEQIKLEHALHVEERLTAAGFGPVKEAGAVALEEAADQFGENQTIRESDAKEWLRARAAAVRSEQ